MCRSKKKMNAKSAAAAMTQRIVLLGFMGVHQANGPR
jgi:hypothetical protein